MLLEGRIETTGFQEISRLHVTVGLDTPFATYAQGYSTNGVDRNRVFGG